MDEQLLDQTAFDSFLLAIRVMSVAFDMQQPASEFHKPFELLREIANGELTMSSPAELAARFPALSELAWETTSSVMAHDREIATRVLRGLGNINTNP